MYIGLTKYLYWAEQKKNIVERTQKSYCVKLLLLNYFFFTVYAYVQLTHVICYCIKGVH